VISQQIYHSFTYLLLCVCALGGGASRHLTVAAAARRHGDSRHGDADDDDDDDGYIANDVDRPIFRPAASNITVSPGGRAQLKCRVDNLGTKTVFTFEIQDGDCPPYWIFEKLTTGLCITLGC